MFTITSTTPTGGNFGKSGTNGTATVTPVAAGTPYSASSYGMRRAPSYNTAPGFKMPGVSLASMQADVRGAFGRTSSLPSKESWTVLFDGPVVVLRGTAADADERRLAEDLIRLTPGVGDVRNELKVKTAE